MNKCHIDISFPDPADKTNAVLSFKAMKVGTSLFLSPSGDVVRLAISYDAAVTLSDMLIKYAENKRRQQEYPYPQTITLSTSIGTITMDAHLAEELTGALLAVVAENEIGDLLDLYQPD